MRSCRAAAPGRHHFRGGGGRDRPRWKRRPLVSLRAGVAACFICTPTDGGLAMMFLPLGAAIHAGVIPAEPGGIAPKRPGGFWAACGFPSCGIRPVVPAERRGFPAASLPLYLAKKWAAAVRHPLRQVFSAACAMSLAGISADSILSFAVVPRCGDGSSRYPWGQDPPSLRREELHRPTAAAGISRCAVPACRVLAVPRLCRGAYQAHGRPAGTGRCRGQGGSATGGSRPAGALPAAG